MSGHSEVIFDPLRRKSVAATAEEKVRQWFIAQLLQVAGVPAHMMMSECGFRFGEKQYRADVVVFDRSGSPLAIVECKRDDVTIDSSVALQAMRYNAVLSVRFIFLTNGRNTFVYAREGGIFKPYGKFPSYQEMLSHDDSDR